MVERTNRKAIQLSINSSTSISTGQPSSKWTRLRAMIRTLPANSPYSFIPPASHWQGSPSRHRARPTCLPSPTPKT